MQTGTNRQLDRQTAVQADTDLLTQSLTDIKMKFKSSLITGCRVLASILPQQKQYVMGSSNLKPDLIELCCQHIIINQQSIISLSKMCLLNFYASCLSGSCKCTHVGQFEMLLHCWSIQFIQSLQVYSLIIHSSK